MGSKRDLTKLLDDFENSQGREEELEHRVKGLLEENKVLGSIVDKLKDQLDRIRSSSRTGKAVEPKDVEAALLELDREYEEYKEKHKINAELAQNYEALQVRYDQMITQFNQ